MVKNNSVAEITFKNPVYEFRSGVHLPTINSRTVFFSTKSTINQGAKLRNVVPENIKSQNHVEFLNLELNT